MIGHAIFLSLLSFPILQNTSALWCPCGPSPIILHSSLYRQAQRSGAQLRRWVDFCICQVLLEPGQKMGRKIASHSRQAHEAEPRWHKNPFSQVPAESGKASNLSHPTLPKLSDPPQPKAPKHSPGLPISQEIQKFPRSPITCPNLGITQDTLGYSDEAETLPSLPHGPLFTLPSAHTQFFLLHWAS